jgi:hypothetical protein
VQAGITTSADDLYSRPVPMLSRKIDGVPAEFDKVMLRALSIDPRARFQTAGEFQEALLRVAHRHGLMMSAPELADHLRSICGDPNRWRNVEATSHGGAPGGTEMYGPEEGTQKLGLSALELDDSEADLVEVLDDDETRSVLAFDVRSQRQKTSITHLTKLQGMELTSMINLADGEAAGAEPLVNLDTFEDEPGVEDDSQILEIARVAGAGRDDTSTGHVLPAAKVPPPNRQGGASGMIGVIATLDDEDDEPGGSRVWMILALILLFGIGIAAAIGFSGPKLTSGDDGQTEAGDP